MKNLSLKLNEDIFEDVEEIVGSIKVKRNKYINDALAYYNNLHKRRLMKIRLAEESKATYGSSMEILTELEALDDNFLD
ncbi:MAG: hypothetical protein RIF46_13585 [Cyclobacteriaceae bacterium]